MVPPVVIKVILRTAREYYGTAPGNLPPAGPRGAETPPRASLWARLGSSDCSGRRTSPPRPKVGPRGVLRHPRPTLLPSARLSLRRALRGRASLAWRLDLWIGLS